MEQMKKCPFCGSEAILYDDHDEGKAYMIGCGDPFHCKVEPMTEWCDTEEEAIAQWNTRAKE